MSPASAPQPDGAASPSGLPRLGRNGLIVAAATMLSRVMGFARDVAIAFFVGAGAGADAFFVAFRIPLLLRQLLAEGAFSAAFIPVLVAHRPAGREAVRALIRHVAGCLLLALAAITLVVLLCAPLLTGLYAPGFLRHPEKFALTVHMVRIMSPYILLISLTALASGILNAYGRFLSPALAPVFLNLSLIGAVMWLSPGLPTPVLVLAWAVVFGGCLQLLIQLPGLLRLGLLPWPQPNWQHPGVRQILILLGPALLGISVTQLNVFLDTVIASFLPTGSVAWLYYAERLKELPVGVFAVAIATVLLPSLAAHHERQASGHFAATLDWGLRCSLLLGIPSMVALLVLAAPVMTSLFEYGRMTPRDSAMAARALQAYALGLPAFMVVRVLVTGYFARQDMKTPVSIAIRVLACNMVLNICLVLPLHYYWRIGHVGLALGTSLAAQLHVLLLLRGLLRSGAYRIPPGSLVFWGRVAAAALVMGVVLVLCTAPEALWREWSWKERGLHMALLCAGGAALYFLVLWLGGLRPSHLHRPGL